MNYLAQRNYIHDLAARNCLLDQRMRVKVSDFGMTTQLNNTLYYRLQKEKPLPREWMAIESLETYVYTTKTDVWSYGVVLWELWTRVSIPYENVANSELIHYLKSGHRLSKPEYCPNIVYDLCFKCLEINPDYRPEFDFIKNKLSACIKQFLCNTSQPIFLNEIYN